MSDIESRIPPILYLKCHLQFRRAKNFMWMTFTIEIIEHVSNSKARSAFGEQTFGYLLGMTIISGHLTAKLISGKSSKQVSEHDQSQSQNGGPSWMVELSYAAP